MAHRGSVTGRAAEKATAERNASIMKMLLKMPGNKRCADCKVNDHPRWASWSLGIFLCIRCSGIHRGMGVHISRVKSVDLDAWTDQQIQNMVIWGNKRSNRYWEAKLADQHFPSESKMENFIRTKYELQRWVMPGGKPSDPSVLDDPTDTENEPLSVVRERVAATSPILATNQATFSDPTPDPKPVQGNSVSTAPSSLLGLDFDSPGMTRNEMSASDGNLAATSRSKLKSSILSLYAPTAKPKEPNSQPTTTAASPALSPATSALGDLNNAFGGLAFTSSPRSTANKAPPAAPRSSSATFTPPKATKKTNDFQLLSDLDLSSSEAPPSRQQAPPLAASDADPWGFSQPSVAPKPVSVPAPVSAPAPAAASAPSPLPPTIIPSQSTAPTTTAMFSSNPWGASNEEGDSFGDFQSSRTPKKQPQQSPPAFAGLQPTPTPTEKPSSLASTDFDVFSSSDVWK